VSDHPVRSFKGSFATSSRCRVQPSSWRRGIRAIHSHLLRGTLSGRERFRKSAASRSPRFVPLLFFLLSIALLGRAQDTQRTVWDGVYNEQQSQRGQTLFVDQCSNCHGRDLEGADMTPALTGGGFMANWDGLSLADLADRIRVSMPLNSPGVLSRQQTADIVAYILQFNQFPAGKEELPREVPAMKQILFKARQ
jgi:mono/diheme cytochrome c family protein